MDSVKMNKNSMGIILGPTSSGKSYFMKKCLRKFESEVPETNRAVK